MLVIQVITKAGFAEMLPMQKQCPRDRTAGIVKDSHRQVVNSDQMKYQHFLGKPYYQTNTSRRYHLLTKPDMVAK